MPSIVAARDEGRAEPRRQAPPLRPQPREEPPVQGLQSSTVGGGG